MTWNKAKKRASIIFYTVFFSPLIDWLADYFIKKLTINLILWRIIYYLAYRQEQFVHDAHDLSWRETCS